MALLSPRAPKHTVQADAKRYIELEQRRPSQGIGHRAGDRLDPVEHRQCDDGRRDARRDPSQHRDPDTGDHQSTPLTTPRL